MSLSPDARLGSYVITGQIGAGGMGEVYRARDVNLDRYVAIKVLPEAFAQDPERLARLEREAKTLAALNHPNIAQIYGFERSGTITALVMELVEGETLAGPMPIDEALAIAKQIASALEVAHEQGIIHRDLKPANIKLRPDGTVKVLDFGLAKLVEGPTKGGPSTPDDRSVRLQPDVTASPTLTIQATAAGIILGTAAYMSPEQARGRPADKRADIWSFGVVLFEMLSGARLFEGEDVSETLAFVLTRTPDWTKLPATVPPAVVTLLKRCLERDRHRRVADMSTVRFVIEEAGSLVSVRSEMGAHEEPLARVKPLWRRLVPLASAVVLTGLVAGATAWTLWPRTSPLTARFVVTLPQDQQFSSTSYRTIALSPDGSKLAYVANGRLYLRPISSLDAVPLTETGTRPISPVFSPDGQSIAFVSLADRTLKRVAIAGGAAVTNCPGETSNVLGTSWDPSGIVIGEGPRGIVRCPANGGSLEQLVPASTTEYAGWPQLLPDGDTLLFAVIKPEGFNAQLSPTDEATIVAQSLRSHARTTIVKGGSAPRYIETGHLLYVQSGILFAAPFNPFRPAPVGGAVPVVEGIRRVAGASFTPQYDVTGAGSLAYIAGPARVATGDLLLVLADRTGKVSRVIPDARSFEHPRASRDGKHVTWGTTDGQDANVWIHDLGTTSSPRRLTTFGGRNLFPIWSGDGSRVAYQSNKEGDPAIFAQRIDGTGGAERLTRPASGVSHVPESWSPDGHYLSFDEIKGESHTLRVLSIADGKVSAMGVESIEPFESTFAPDGHWIAYHVRPRDSDARAADRGLYVQRFPAAGLPQQLPKVNGDFHPVWTSGGKELVYVAAAVLNQFAAVSVTTSPSLSFGSPTSFTSSVQDKISTDRRNFDLLPDGQFIGVALSDRDDNASAAGPREIRIVLNWFEELKARVQVK